MQCFFWRKLCNLHVTDGRDLAQLLLQPKFPAACPLVRFITITMDVLLRTAVVLWISAGFLPFSEKSEACTGNDLPAPCDLVFRNVCLELEEESETWSQARSRCEERGGELLKVMNGPIKLLLKNISKERNTSNFTWWLGEGVQGEPSRSE